MISLFSGAMGLDLGLEAAGMRTAVAVEKYGIAVETVKLNKGKDFPILDEPIERFDTEEILDFGDLRAREAFVLIGGPCCQSFSTAGSSSNAVNGFRRHSSKRCRRSACTL